MVLLAALSTFLMVFPDAAPSDRLPVRTYTSADGLPNDQIHAIEIDQLGFVWFCSAQGVTQFDGRTFRTFGLADGLPPDTINDILPDGNHRYWIASNGAGLVLFTPRTGDTAATAASRFTKFAVGESPAANRVNVLAHGREGTLWLGTDGGLFRMREEHGRIAIHRIAPAGSGLDRPLLQIWSLIEDRRGRVWAGTSIGLFIVLPNGHAQHYPIQPRQGADHIWALLEEDDRFLVGHDSGLFTATVSGEEGGEDLRVSFSSIPVFTGTRGQLVRAVHRARDGRLWVGGSEGIGALEGGRWHDYSASLERPGTISTIAEDASGAIWLGFVAGGAARLLKDGFVAYDHRDGLPEATVMSVQRCRGADLCLVDRRQNITVWRDGRFTEVRPRFATDVQGAGRGVYGNALQDHLGEWWIPTGDRLYRFPAVSRPEMLATTSPKAVYTMADGLGGGDIWRMFEDSRGDIWMSHRIPERDVITVWNRATGTFHRYGVQHGLRPQNAAVLYAEGPTGTVWIAFWDGGVARYISGRFEWIPEFDGIGSTGPLRFDRKGRLWVCTLRGVRRVDDPNGKRPMVVTQPVDHPFETDRILNMTEDAAGRFLLASSRSVIQLDVETGTVTRFRTPDELRIVGRSAVIDAEGALWIAASTGVARFIPPEKTVPQPSLRIARLRVNGNPRPVADLGQQELQGLVLSSSERRVEIGVLALNSGAAEDYAFEYMLEGSSGEWTPVDPSMNVPFAHLAAGSYRFVVRARDSLGNTIGLPAIVQFRIEPPIWLRWWFATLLLAGIGAAGTVFHRRRLARAVELERIRTHIASDLHDDIGANLSQIALLSEVLHARRTDEASANSILGSIADLSRESVDAMSDIVWAIDPQKDRVGNLISRMRRFANDLLGAGEVDFTLDVDRGIEDVLLPADVRRQAYLIFKEGLNNVVRHSGAKIVNISVRIEGAALQIAIRDDGKGFEVQGRHEGHGLRSLRKRAERSGGTLTVTSAPGAGTSVALAIPCRTPHMNM